MQFFIVHELPGRIRFRTTTDFNRSFAVSLADRLDAIPGIEGVRVNPRTGSVLLLYVSVEARNAARAVLASGLECGIKEEARDCVPESEERPSCAPLVR